MISELNKITQTIIASAVAVHRELGAGLLESAYEACLAYELIQHGLIVERQKALPINYRGITVDCGYRIDLLVENKVICELKAVETVNPVWEAQILSHLKLSNKRLGYLINFNVTNIGMGIRRFVI